MSFQYCYITALIVLSPVRCLPDYLTTLATLHAACTAVFPDFRLHRPDAARSGHDLHVHSALCRAEILTQTRYLTKLDFSLTFCYTVDDETCSCHSKQCGKTNLVCFANTILGFSYPALPSFISLQFPRLFSVHQKPNPDRKQSSGRQLPHNTRSPSAFLLQILLTTFRFLSSSIPYFRLFSGHQNLPREGNSHRESSIATQNVISLRLW